MPAPRMPFVGRREEMAALEDEFARAAGGEFRVVLLSGEAGVGKSRLGRELLTRHPEAAGMFARAHPLGVTAAFGVWAEAIDPLLRSRSDPLTGWPRTGPASSASWCASRRSGRPGTASACPEWTSTA
jgi:hypothetical protein